MKPKPELNAEAKDSSIPESSELGELFYSIEEVHEIWKKRYVGENLNDLIFKENPNIKLIK